MLLSVIIPHYNNASLLARCLKSLTDADLGDDVQVIVVDDGSTPQQRAQVESLFKQLTTYHLILTTHHGASAARNTGLLSAQGRFVWFVDADDEVDTAMLKLWWSKLKEMDDSVDLLHFGPMKTANFGHWPLAKSQEPRAKSQKPAANSQQPTSNSPHTLDHTTYWISRRFLDRNPDIRYLENVELLEDSIFVLHLLDRAKNIVSAHDCTLYIRHADAPSLTAGVWSKEKSARFMPCVNLFFQYFSHWLLAISQQPTANGQQLTALYHRYCYVYMRVLAVKGVPRRFYDDYFYNTFIRDAFIPQNPKEWLLKNPILHASISFLCRLLRSSHD